MALKSGFEKVWAIILEKVKIKLPEALHMEATKKVTSYEDWDYMKHPEFRQGVLGSSLEEVFGIGKIISALRKEQHLTLQELVKLHRTLPKDAFWTTLVFMSYYLANLCQAYGILHMYDEAEEYATQSYYLFLLYGNKNAAARLKEFMLDDNGIVIG